MSRICSICGKGKLKGNLVSHSLNRTNTNWRPNLQKVKIDDDGQVKSEYVCTKCLKTMNKN